MKAAAGILLVLVLLLVTLAAGIEARSMEVCDDAFISFRMARNLADGHGLRFNPDGPRVEAASNFSLTVLLAGARAAGLSMLHASLGIAVASAVLTLLLLGWVVWRSCGPWGLWAPAALATMTVFHRNMLNGLETSLFGMLLLGAVVLYVRSNAAGGKAGKRALVLSSVLVALVSMTRPEGPMYMVALGVPRLLDLWRRWRRRQPLALGTEALWAGGFFAVYLPYFAWRVHYFGKLLPNTYHAKETFFTSGLHKLQLGAIYLEVMALMEPLLPAALLAGVWLLVVAPSKRVRTLVAVVTAQVLFMVLSGGDWSHMFGFGRFLFPALPLALWLLAEAGACLVAPERYARLTDRPEASAGAASSRRRLALVGIAAVLLVLSQVNLLQLRGLKLPPHFHLLQDRSAPLTRQAVARAYLHDLRRLPLERWMLRATSSFRLDRYDGTFDALAGLWLRDRYGVDTPMATIQAGQFAFWSGMPVFDLFGLTTPDVAETRQDPKVLFAKISAFGPKIITFYRWGNDLHNRGLVHDGALWRAGYGLRYVLQWGTFRAFLVFEKGYTNRVDPEKILNTPLRDLPFRVEPERWVAMLTDRHPRLWP